MMSLESNLEVHENRCGLTVEQVPLNLKWQWH